MHNKYKHLISLIVDTPGQSASALLQCFICINASLNISSAIYIWQRISLFTQAHLVSYGIMQLLLITIDLE